MIAIRGRTKLIWAATILIVLLNYIVVAGWVIGAHNDRMSDHNLAADQLGQRDKESELTNNFSLMWYLFPPFWWPSLARGTGVAFLFDYYRQYESHSGWVWV